MKHTFGKIAIASALSLSLAAGSLMLNTTGAVAAMNRQGGLMNDGVTALADTAGEIVSGTTTNSAASLSADTENATAITMTDEDNQVTISESGTYIITGSASDGSITVKKGTTGVVLVLEDLDLTSTTGAAVSINKESEVQIVVSGSVTLTDNENPADENSGIAEVADAYDGAALKIKAGSSVYLTGDGTLTVNGNAKNGIKVGDSEASLVVDGEDLTVNITAANDGINAGYDLTIASGTVNISASDDALHADRVLTVGTEDGTTSPTVNIISSSEGLEGTVVNIHSGNVSVNSTDDAINAANKDDLYGSELAYSINVTGGTVTVNSRADGLDSNGNVNVTGGEVSISSASFGGEAGIDYDGQLYVSADATLNNGSGVSGPDRMRGQMGQMTGMNGQSGQMGRMNGRQAVENQTGNQAGESQTAAPDFSQNEEATPALPEMGQTTGNQNAMPDFNGFTGNQRERGSFDRMNEQPGMTQGKGRQMGGMNQSMEMNMGQPQMNRQEMGQQFGQQQTNTQRNQKPENDRSSQNQQFGAQPDGISSATGK